MTTVEIGSEVKWMERTERSRPATLTRRIITKEEFSLRLDRAIASLGDKPNPRSLYEVRSRLFDEFMDHSAPIAIALLNHEVGDTVELDTQAGRKFIRILEIH